MLEISYTLNLRQLLKIVHELKRYFWQKLKQKKTQNVSKVTIDKQVGSLVLEIGLGIVTIDDYGNYPSTD
jgi:hypothetical protein